MDEERPMAHPFEPVLEILKGRSPEDVCAQYRISRDELQRKTAEYQALCRRVTLQESLPSEKIERNAPCPCGSGKKYKKCCLATHEEIRKTMPNDDVLRQEQRAREKKRLEEDIQRGFSLLVERNFEKAQRVAQRLLSSYPQDDRLHDMLVTASLALGDYDQAFFVARERWQVAREEKTFFQEYGYHKRERDGHFVHIYSPDTWLEKFWIAQRARYYREAFPTTSDSVAARFVSELNVANDMTRFPQRDEEGYRVRREALDATIQRLKEIGVTAIPLLLPLTYTFSWGSLFVPEIIAAIGTDLSLQLLAELSMFRYPFFAQLCLKALESFGERAVPPIKTTIEQHRAFDELKVGIIMVLGKIPSRESFDILVSLTEHESPYLVNWVAQALASHENPDALPFLERAKQRLGELSKIAGAINDLVKMGRKGNG